MGSSILCFSMQTSLSKIHSSVVVNFCENRLFNESWLKETFFPLFEFLFSARTVLYMKSSIDNGCLKPPFFVSFQGIKVLPEWLKKFQWTFKCFATGHWTVEHLYQKYFFSEETRNTFLMWVSDRKKNPKYLFSNTVKLIFECCHSAVRSHLGRL